jgi:hypothetical protein
MSHHHTFYCPPVPGRPPQGRSKGEGRSQNRTGFPSFAPDVMPLSLALINRFSTCTRKIKWWDPRVSKVSMQHGESDVPAFALHAERPSFSAGSNGVAGLRGPLLLLWRALLRRGGCRGSSLPYFRLVARGSGRRRRVEATSARRRARGSFPVHPRLEKLSGPAKRVRVGGYVLGG